MFFSKKIKQFIMIANKGSFKEAADELCLSPSALSKGMKEIEEQLGVQLFQHSRRNAKLTVNGELLYRELFPYYQDVNSTTKRLMKSFSNSKKNVINIATDGTLFPSLSSIISKICSSESSFLVDVRTYPNHLISDIIFHEKADIFIGLRNEDNLHSSIESMDLTPNFLGLAVTKHIIKYSKSNMDLLLTNNIIQTENMLFLKEFEQIKKHLLNLNYNRSIITIPNIYDVLQALRDGAGISFVPQCEENLLLIKKYDLALISPPSPFNIKINRKIYYKRENKEELQWLIKLIHI
ncbi:MULTISPECIES: helix-turn-helix domain-containing protein [Photorhabdus]|uniref:Lysr-family transcriptional regulatory protein n=2 Tax=Photorhabdus asymbiotica TaxID=291112 RepID=B6VL02_PHOAA|nr:LysR family transcriptional regulator [Photorhabdus asymbiotica]RKS65771.1 DNA-binding transcriptional LysR family regulator [Photorhabdus asymbiotica]CAQ84343.1 putative lysr-family transcriptional regulatory protein [Photorhabdus asymbiotica]CAR66832.1 putative lysr-family transcriptional regulatory protein [Photorhabdus asymbiotica subsp. asymbiotica ATCC 43949]